LDQHFGKKVGDLDQPLVKVEDLDQHFGEKVEDFARFSYEASWKKAILLAFFKSDFPKVYF
jgi:hypothetical protein